MDLLVLSTSVLVVVAGVWFDDYFCTVLGGGFLILYLLLLVRDLYLALAAMREALRGTSAKRMVKGRPYQFTTSFGQYLGSEIDSLRYRVNNLSWQSESALLPSRTVPDGELLRELSELPSLELEGRPKFFEKLLDYAQTKLHCRACALVLQEGEEGSYQIVSRGLSTKAFQSALRYFVQPYFETGQKNIIGLRDGFSKNEPLADFLNFGVRFTLTLPFSVVSPEGDLKGLFWLGYSSDRPPTDLERDLARNIANKISAEFDTLKRVYELSTEVAEAKSAEGQKSQFLAQMSHDIRSPLNNIRAILSLFKLENKDSERSMMLEAALQNCVSVGEIIEDVLDFSRHCSGKLSPRKEPFNLVTTVADVVEGFKVAASLKGVALQYNSHETQVAEVLADSKHIRRIVTNLLSNALNYTTRGEVKVDVSQSGPDLWSLAVSDTGCGMSADELKGLFTPFTRYNVKRSEGIGLGLAITKILVEINGGSINVNSVPGRGSRFEVTLPAIALEQSPEEPSLSEIIERLGSEMQPMLSTDFLVLVICSAKERLELLSRGLQLRGLRIQRAQTITEAKALMNFENPSAVIAYSNLSDGPVSELLTWLAFRKNQTPCCVLTDNEANSLVLHKIGAELVLPQDAPIAEIAGWAIRKFREQSTKSSQKAA